ncbi:protein kinase domain-containing protein [Colletotrichum incanum]|uniref:Protein kinase domain-containing protein n=1 Tax=Colletotrichum incanum TaxID=1573173 RepID=A0A166VBC4_COLIC|nr:protein kinase domain-containing protein [Colletotrichum incanum]
MCSINPAKFKDLHDRGLTGLPHAQQPWSSTRVNKVKDELSTTHNTMVESRRISQADPQPECRGLLASHFNVSRASNASLPVAWKDGFPGGPIINQNSEGEEISGAYRVVNEPSDSGEGDTVVSVYDLGHSAAPGPAHGYPSYASDPMSKISKEHHQPSAKEIEDDIRNRIERSLCWSKMDRKQYLPRGSFEEIFTPAILKTVIRCIYPDAFEEEFFLKVDQIVGDAKRSRRKIIATLIFMKQTSCIEDFIREGIFDSDMPLRNANKSIKEFRTAAGSVDQGVHVNTTLFQHWERVYIDLFYIYQKMIFVPYFKMDDSKIRSHVFDWDIRLPWETFEHKMTGGHGIVHQLQIHPSHHNFKGNNKKPELPLYFAVKEIHAADHESYRKELRALEMSCAKVQREKHLVKLLFTFQHGERLYLVFEWADGNLQQFWARKRVEDTPLAAQWMAHQCRGIANAIKRIHGLTTWQKEERLSTTGTDEAVVKDWGRHGDIKPSNILWFSEYGVDQDLLVVADLGLTRYHSRLTKSRVLRVDGFTGTYRAPEIDLGDFVSAKYDIWSLGCVFFEFCIWYLLGGEYIQNFENDRRANHLPGQVDETGEVDYGYFLTTHMPGEKNRVELNPAVPKWVEKLKRHEIHSPFIYEILDLIMTQMLVVDPGRRSSIDMISYELSRIESSIPKTPGDGADSSGLTDIYKQSSPTTFVTNQNSVPRESLVRFAEGNSIIGANTKPSRHGRGRTLSIATSDRESSEESSSYAQSTAPNSVFDDELDQALMQQDLGSLRD